MLFFYSVYTGRRENASVNGLGYDVVTKLVQPYTNQGYNIYIDNFYTSINLLKTLQEKGFNACGTARTNRKGFPPVSVICDYGTSQIYIFYI